MVKCLNVFTHCERGIRRQARMCCSAVYLRFSWHEMRWFRRVRGPNPSVVCGSTALFVQSGPAASRWTFVLGLLMAACCATAAASDSEDIAYSFGIPPQLRWFRILFRMFLLRRKQFNRRMKLLPRIPRLVQMLWMKCLWLRPPKSLATSPPTNAPLCWKRTTSTTADGKSFSTTLQQA